MKKIVSMSRRTDMYWHGERLVSILNEKYPPERVHTVVCWTKFPQAILDQPFHDILSSYSQVYIQLTVTGLGGTPLEPNVPPWTKAMEQIPELIKFAGRPERIRLRPDPLVALKTTAGDIISNIKLVERIITAAGQLGIKNFSTSFMEEYPKVRLRLKNHGFSNIVLGQKKRKEIIEGYAKIVQGFGGRIYTCCVPGLKGSACIDGNLLSALHPAGKLCSTAKAKGQRKLCGCSESVDVGWYTMTCKSGCLYCYANTRG